MKRWAPRLLAALLVLGMGTVVACDSETESKASDAQQQVKDASKEVKKEVKDAWSGLNVDSSRLIDQIQTRNDPQAKQQLLDKCRDTVEKMKKSDTPSADNVNKLCDQVRDTDPNNKDAWNKVKDQFKELNTKYGTS